MDFLRYIFEKGFFINIAGGISTAVLISLSLWFRNNFINLVNKIMYLIIAIIHRKKYVLIWNDDDLTFSQKLSRQLRKSGTPALYKALNNPKEILQFPTTPLVVSVIIIIVFDVTKLSEDEKLRITIQKALINFLEKGCGIIGTHDIIYKRVRNELLENAFGCRLTEYRKQQEVTYKRCNKVSPDHLMFRDLPDCFNLTDGEICWGRWAPDSQVLYFSDEKKPKPLVVAREYRNGKLIWINSGDKTDFAPKSIAVPEKEFFVLLKNAIEWVVS